MLIYIQVFVCWSNLGSFWLCFHFKVQWAHSISRDTFYIIRLDMPTLKFGQDRIESSFSVRILEPSQCINALTFFPKIKLICIFFIYKICVLCMCTFSRKSYNYFRRYFKITIVKAYFYEILWCFQNCCVLLRSKLNKYRWLPIADCGKTM